MSQHILRSNQVLFPMAGDQRRSVVVYCVEAASVAISGKEEARQAEQLEVGYIFSATELLSLPG